MGIIVCRIYYLPLNGGVTISLLFNNQGKFACPWFLAGRREFVCIGAMIAAGDTARAGLSPAREFRLKAVVAFLRFFHHIPEVHYRLDAGRPGYFQGADVGCCSARIL